MTNKVRVRYAPSPTGEPHVGNLRTALFNWLFARHAAGTFIVRVEDTDMSRKVEGATEQVLEALRWLGLDWDEGPEVGGPHGPYFQSERLELYAAAAKELISSGQAYYCYCTPQELEDMRAEQARQGKPPGYDRRCRYLSAQERSRLEREKPQMVVRFAIPLEGQGQIRFHDLIRGEVAFDTALLGDFVILKSDGYPTYHLANVVDDHVMEITHVLRAEEWLPSTPRHLLLYQALGYQPPLYAHLPMILGPDRSKLSKRHGATSVLEYQRQGYLPDALVNFLALLGWSLDDKTEIMAREDLIRHFSLERVAKASAIFNIEKLQWLNGVYIRRLSQEDLANELMPFLERDLPREVERPLSRQFVAQIVPLIQERLRTLGDASQLVGFLLVNSVEHKPEELVQKGMDRASTAEALKEALKLLEGVELFNTGALESDIRSLAEKLNLKASQLFGALRVAVTGRSAAPPLFQTMEALGRERCIQRVRQAIKRLQE